MSIPEGRPHRRFRGRRLGAAVAGLLAFGAIEGHDMPKRRAERQEEGTGDVSNTDGINDDSTPFADSVADEGRTGTGQRGLREGIAAVGEALRQSQETKHIEAKFRTEMLDTVRDYLASMTTGQIAEDMHMYGFTPEQKEQMYRDLAEYIAEVTVKEVDETLQLQVAGNPIVIYRFVTGFDGQVDIHITEIGTGRFDQREGVDPTGMTWMMNSDFKSWWDQTGRAALLNTIEQERALETYDQDR